MVLFLDNSTWYETIYLANILTRCSSPPHGNKVKSISFIALLMHVIAHVVCTWCSGYFHLQSYTGYNHTLYAMKLALAVSAQIITQSEMTYIASI